MDIDPAARRQLREARGKFAAMATTYGLGVFNDSLYRQAAMLLAVALGLPHLQGWVITIFTLPYLLFAAPAGWLADRFAKRHVVIAAKGLEVVAMICGAVGIATANWVFVFIMAFAMGLQSCLFSPALNGSIPELYPDEFVGRANARLKVVVTIMILAGGVAASAALDCEQAAWLGVPLGRLIVAGGVVGIAALGLAIAFGSPRRPPADPSARFPWSGPRETLRQVRLIGADRLLSVIVAADVFAWFIGAMLWPMINALVIEQLGHRKAIAGAMFAMELIGVAVGGLLGGRLAQGPKWYRILPPGAFVLAAALCLVGGLPLLPVEARLPAAFGLMGLAGVAGGLILIPCEAFVQTRPAAERKGRVIAAANFLVFVGIMLSGAATSGLIALWIPSTGVMIAGLAALPVAMWLTVTLRGGRLR